MSDDPQQKIQRFQQMVERFPESELPRFSLAQAYLDAEQYSDAERTFAEVIGLKPDYMMAWVHRTQALMAMDEFEAAKPVCERAIELAREQDHQGPLADCEYLLEEIVEELDA